MNLFVFRGVGIYMYVCMSVFFLESLHLQLNLLAANLSLLYTIALQSASLESSLL